jgi:glycosyltransferase involved in cell wall biosynthesis
MTGPGAEPRRVLWLVKGLGPGGAEQLMVNQAQVRDRETFVTEAVYLVPWKDHLVPRLHEEGVPAECLGSGKDWDMRWAWRLRRRLRHRPVDVVHHHSPLVGSVTRLLVRTLPRRVRPALVYTEHNRWPRHNRLTRLLNRATFSLDDQTFAVSDDVRETIPEHLRARVEVLVHGVDVAAVQEHRSQRSSVRQELGIDPAATVIGIVANFRREKAYEVWVEAARLALESGLPLRFVSVGQGPLEAEVRAMVTDLGLDGPIQLLGYREDALRIMSAFDIFTLSSRHEGLPVSLMEALAMGLPVVATSVGGMTQAVRDGVEALLVPADDPAALAAAYVEVAADPALRARLAGAAAARGADFGMEAPTRRLERAYLEAAANRRS